MVLFDIVIGIILLFALIKGGINGFIKELASFLALIVGLLGAIFISNSFSQWLGTFWDFKYIGAVSFLLVFVGIVIGVHLLAKALDKMVEGLALGVLNRLAGAVFSALKYLFVISVLISILSFFEKESVIIGPEDQKASYLYKPVSTLAPTVFSYLDFDTPWNNDSKEKSPKQEIMI